LNYYNRKLRTDFDMMQLNTTYKPLTATPVQKSLNQQHQFKTIDKSRDSFKNQFLAARRNIERTEAERYQALKEQTDAMEADFVKIMVNQMFKTINKSGFIDGGQGEEMFQSMLYDQYAETISKTGNLGISDILFKQITGQ